MTQKTFAEDLRSTLDKVERKWIRRPALIMITPFIILFGAIGGIIETMGIMYKNCW